MRIRELTRTVERLDSLLYHTKARLTALQRTKLFRYTRHLRSFWIRLRTLTTPSVSRAPETAGPLASALKGRGAPSKRLRIRQIYYSEDQRASLMPGADPYFNEHAGPFLENRVIAECVRQQDHRNCDYYGVLSWRFQQKVENHLSFSAIERFIDRDPHPADVYVFTGQQPGANIWRMAVERWHPPRLAEIAQKIFDRLGVKQDLLELDTTVIHSNYWLAKPEILDRYMNEMLIPAMELMENDPEIRAMCFEDSGYGELFQDPQYREIVGHDALSEEVCLRIFGKPYYPYHPFVCERLMSSWLAINPHLRCTPIN